MKQFFLGCSLILSASLAFAQNYTLMTIKQKEKTNAENFFVEISKEVFKRADLRLHVEQSHWLKAQKKVMRANPDMGLVITPLTRTSQREDDFDWILPLEQYQLQLISNVDSVNIVDTNALKELPVCALRESPAEFKLRELGFKNIRAQVQEKNCYKQLLKGKVDLIMSFGKVSSEKRYAEVGGKAEDLVYGLSFREETLYLASTKGAVSDADKAKLTKALSDMKGDGSYKEIRLKY